MPPLHLPRWQPPLSEQGLQRVASFQFRSRGGPVPYSVHDPETDRPVKHEPDRLLDWGAENGQEKHRSAYKYQGYPQVHILAGKPHYQQRPNGGERSCGVT